MPEENKYPRTNDDDEEKRALRHLVTIYATWAYTERFLTADVLSTVDKEGLARRCFDNYRSVFSFRRFRRLYREAVGAGANTVRIHNLVVQTHRVRQRVRRHRCSAARARVALHSVDVNNPSLRSEYSNLYGDTSVVPAALVWDRTKNVKTWAVVTPDDDYGPTLVDDGVPMTPAYARNELMRILREVR